MAFTTDELIQIGLIIGILIVFGYAAYVYLKNKGFLELNKTKEKRTEEKTKKPLSFSKNRKMRELEKMIPEKKLDRKIMLTELRFGDEKGLWEPEPEKKAEPPKIIQPETKIPALKPEIKAEKTSSQAIREMIKEPEKKSILSSLFGQKKTEPQTQEKKFEFKQETKPEKPIQAKQPDFLKKELKPAETKAKPEQKKETGEKKGLFESIKSTLTGLTQKKEMPLEKTTKPVKDKTPIKEKETTGKFAERKETTLMQLNQQETEAMPEKPLVKETEELLREFPPKREPREKTEYPKIGRKLDETIKKYEEMVGKKDKPLFESEKEKEKHEKRFVQKILDSNEEEELEKISKAIEPQSDDKWRKEKQETISALKKEFSELEKKDKKDLWGDKTEEEQEKPLVKETEKLLGEFKSNGKFAAKKAVEAKPDKEKEKSAFLEEMKKLVQVSKTQIAKQKGIPEKKEAPETEKQNKDEKKKLVVPRKTAKEQEEKLRKIVEEKKEAKKKEEEKELKKKEEPKKPEPKTEKKKGFFERIGFGKEKVVFSKEEEDQIKKIMIVLKGKTAEYSKEDMIEAMKNLGYEEKIIQEVLKRIGR
ncbi:MAG: hypothetical protein ABH986_06010 [archaeon]